MHGLGSDGYPVSGFGVILCLAAALVGVVGQTSRSLWPPQAVALRPSLGSQAISGCFLGLSPLVLLVALLYLTQVVVPSLWNCTTLPVVSIVGRNASLVWGLFSVTYLVGLVVVFGSRRGGGFPSGSLLELLWQQCSWRVALFWGRRGALSALRLS